MTSRLHRRPAISGLPLASDQVLGLQPRCHENHERGWPLRPALRPREARGAALRRRWHVLRGWDDDATGELAPPALAERNVSPVAIPAWTAEGVLPPVNTTQPVSPERSPYTVSLTDYVLRFGDTPERRVVVDGLLRFRAALHAVGMVAGFQWLDGSFLEQVERIEGRPPNDVDLVTFYRLPPGRTQQDLVAAHPILFDHNHVKSSYLVDGYFEHLGMAPERLTKQSAYWYSVWSHRRNQFWKGFVQVDLAPIEDAAAGATLASLNAGGRP
jgi:hypothetical protein